MMLAHIASYSVNLGFENTLHKLTRVPVKIISQLKNEFKSEFWANVKECPIKDCDFIGNKPSITFRHVGIHHNLGVHFYNCFHCEFKTKHLKSLKNHLIDKHDIDVKWYKCPKCEFKTKYSSRLKNHLAYKHDIGVKLYECPECGYKAKHSSSLKRHIAGIHNIS